ncbi:chorismate pyruvate-lyase family protein [Streptomyces sp. TLI_171]|uniref:chorismate pyruvate-lyase family protein n=1 Tax=Streptomyces sp. TLI_171 TaxID=1938859 RepID=UPI000C1A4643|nr:chorismate pyruvate-lyase family protein [Streptomyces sp. TLI_171]RKE21679.1 chorismate lyase [Streptomyces sp. TLI_171]
MPLQSIDVSAHAFTARKPAETAVRIGRFAAAPTRMLLSADGLTTTLLEAWTGAPARIGRADHRRLPATDAPAGAAALLRAESDEDLIVRRSVLAGGDGSELSRNVVVARPALSAAAEHCLTDTAAPIGAALHASGTAYRRTVLDAGVRDWDGAPAAYKTYLMWHGQQPLAAVTETFNPAVVPAALGAGLLAAGGCR